MFVFLKQRTSFGLSNLKTHCPNAENKKQIELVNGELSNGGISWNNNMTHMFVLINCIKSFKFLAQTFCLRKIAKTLKSNTYKKLPDFWKSFRFFFFLFILFVRQSIFIYKYRRFINDDSIAQAFQGSKIVFFRTIFSLS